MKKRMKNPLVFAAASIGISQSIIAQNAPEDSSVIDELDSIVVIGTADNYEAAEASDDLAGPYDVITREELRYEHPDDTVELFTKLPGINIARYNQGIVNADIGIRGFGADGVTPHAKLLIDGVPWNIHNGFNELDQLFPLAIGSIQTFKGTSDIRYGHYNVAGSYNVFSRTDITNEIQTTVDSFGSWELQAYSGTEVGRLTQNYFLGYRDGKGFRDRTDLQKFSLSGNWKFDIDDTTSVGLSDGDVPGYFSSTAAARRNPRQSTSFASQDGGDKELYNITAYLDKTFLDGRADLSLKAYYNDIHRNRFVRFSERGTLRNRVDDQQIYGFIATTNWEINPTFRVKAGVDYQKQDVLDNRWNALRDPADSTRFLTRPDLASPRRLQEYTLETIGGYIGVEHELNDAFRWNAGLRVDRLDGRFDDFRTGASNVNLGDDDAIFQPKLNIFYDLTDEVLLFANYGRTFQTAFGSALFETAPGAAAEVSENDGGEIGISYSPSEDTTVRLSGWYQVANNEFQFDQFLGGVRDIGKVERQGLELAFNHRVNDAFNFWGNVSYSKSEIEDASGQGDTFENAVGTEVRGTPNITYSLGGSYNVTDKLTLRLAIDGQGDYYINEANVGGKFGDYFIVNLGADYQLGNGLLTLQINNLTDEFYEYVFDFSQDGSSTIHSPGDGINASLSYSFEF